MNTETTTNTPATKVTLAKIVSWLETLDSHNIYGHKLLAEDFTKATGEQPCWPIRTHAQTRAAIRKRGLGGTLANTSEPLTYGWCPVNRMKVGYLGGSFKPSVHTARYFLEKAKGSGQ